MKKSIGTFTKITLVIFLIIFGFSLGCQKKLKQAITEEQAKVILDQYMETMNKGDLALIDKIIDPKFILHSPFFPEPIKGIEAYKAMVINTKKAFSDFTATIDEIVVKGDKIFGRFSMSGINTGPLGKLPPTGKKFKITGMAITRVKKGMIVEDETYWNVLALFQQLGFTLSPPQVEKQN